MTTPMTMRVTRRVTPASAIELSPRRPTQPRWRTGRIGMIGVLGLAAIAWPSAASAEPPRPASPALPVSQDAAAGVAVASSGDAAASAGVAPVEAGSAAAPVDTVGETTRVAGTAAAAPMVAHPWAGLYFRLGGAAVRPVTSSRALELADVSGPASLAVQDGPIAGSGATIGSAAIPAGIIGWVWPTQSRRWSAELVIGTPFTVKFEATGTLATMSIAPTALGIPTGVGPLGPDLGQATAVPLVVTSVYQLTGGGLLRPYVGAGASVLLSEDAKVTNPVLTAIRAPQMVISPAPGLVVQGGLDVHLWRWLYARLDVKFIALRAHAEVHNIEVATPGLPLFQSVEVGTAKMDVWVNPFIVLAGVGADFDAVDVYRNTLGKLF